VIGCRSCLFAVCLLPQACCVEGRLATVILTLQMCCRARLAGLQRLVELSDAEVSKLFPYLADLLEADPEQHIRPRWDLLQSLLGEWAGGMCGMRSACIVV
jgi:hypothetical protein